MYSLCQVIRSPLVEWMACRLFCVDSILIYYHPYTHTNKFPENWIEIILTNRNAFENVVGKMAAFLFSPEGIKTPMDNSAVWGLTVELPRYGIIPDARGGSPLNCATTKWSLYADIVIAINMIDTNWKRSVAMWRHMCQASWSIYFDENLLEIQKFFIQ